MKRNVIPIVLLAVCAVAMLSSSLGNVPRWFAIATAFAAVEDNASTSTRRLEDSLPSPTASPTESPAPSPSPSDVPTDAPSHTAKPTATPTAAPTESPAPSPSPSSMPSDAPSSTPSASPSAQPTTTPFPTHVPSSGPSATPSAQPSATPSSEPTVSSQPSQMPSDSPSQSPSAVPTLSVMPSSTPSAPPTTSAQPSSYPTYIGTQTARFNITLGLTELLSDDQARALERGTRDWVPQAALEDQGTHVLKQPVVEFRRQGLQPSLQHLYQLPNGTMVPVTELWVVFVVTAIYAGSDVNFTLFDALNPLFHVPDKLWIHLLGNYNPVFLPLRQDTISPITGASSSTGQVALSTGGLVGILIVALVATTLAVSASVYGIRTYQWSWRGLPDANGGTDMIVEELIMPPSQDEEDVLLTQEDYGEDLKIYETTRAPKGQDLNEAVIYSDYENPFVEESQVQQHPPPKPRTSRVSEGSISELFRPNHFYFNAGRPFKNDPPSAASEANFRRGIDQETKDPSEQAPSGSSRPAETKTNAQRSVVQQIVQQKAPSVDVASRGGEDQNHILTLTRSAGGTYGARERKVAPSDYSAGTSNASSFFSSMVSGVKESGVSEVVPLGARPIAHEDIGSKPSFDSSQHIPQGAGLYDVFAPAGPIGIIVDTTKNGPAVHSLKNTSPMIGLINPGDLIVALDDQDTRTMNAATLTRLMAQKATQKERKITLIAVDNY